MYVTYPDKLNSWPDAARASFTLIAILNHGKNFAVYCLTSSDMREALREAARSLLARFKGGGRDIGEGECGEGSDVERRENENGASRILSASGLTTASTCA